MSRPHSTHACECRDLHTRLLKCTLEVEHSRAYWQRMATYLASAASTATAKRTTAQRVSTAQQVTAKEVHEAYWFGARGLERTGILLTNFRARFGAFPNALQALATWTDMPPLTRRLICHWHLQLSDPLYRAFTGRYLVDRHQSAPAQVSHPLVVRWVLKQGRDRWGMATCIQFASKLLSSAHAAGLVASVRDPRPLTWPKVDDWALAYLLYLLRAIEIEGDLLRNPYLASVGLSGDLLEQRLKRLPGLGFRRQGDVIDLTWHHSDLGAWAEAQFATSIPKRAGVSA